MPESPGDRIKKAVDKAIWNYIVAHGKNPKTITLSVGDFTELWCRIRGLGPQFPPECPYCKHPFFSYGNCVIMWDKEEQQGRGTINGFWTFYAYAPE